MYPKMLVDPAVVAMTDDELTRQGPPAPVRRLLLEGRDGILRALRARARDVEAGR
jgi:aminopeptidase N